MALVEIKIPRNMEPKNIPRVSQHEPHGGRGRAQRGACPHHGGRGRGAPDRAAGRGSNRCGFEKPGSSIELEASGDRSSHRIIVFGSTKLSKVPQYICTEPSEASHRRFTDSIQANVEADGGLFAP